MRASCTTLLRQNLIDVALQNVVGKRSGDLLPIAFVDYFHGGRLAEAVDLSLGQVGGYRIVQVHVVFHQVANFLHFARRQNLGHFAIHVAIGRPRRLHLEDLIDNQLIAPNLARRIGVTRRKARVLVLRQREVAVQ